MRSLFGRFIPLLASVLMLMLLMFASRAGSAWESMAHPTPGVVVTRPDGTRLEGAFSPDWSGHFLLTKQDGARMAVDDAKMIVFPVVGERRSFLERWRSWSGMALVFVLYIGGLLYLRGRTFSAVPTWR